VGLEYAAVCYRERVEGCSMVKREVSRRIERQTIDVATEGKAD
jgi:DNA-binding TFAR19-related protein (PDSD5 family)